MASLKDLRNRIASVKATRKITKAMQMVAAAKLRRAQEAAVAARPYSERMALFSQSCRIDGGKDGVATAGRYRQRPDHLLIVALRAWLCGGFNARSPSSRVNTRPLIAKARR
jgi:F-type H+-transporting ATPase subunit gamma